MPEARLTFQKFNDPELATTIAAQLSAQGIASQVVNEPPVFDPTFANNDFEPTIHLKLAPADFTRAHATLERFYESQLNGLDPDYYLLSFTDDELLELVKRPDEWGHLDYALAKQLLAQRGKPVTPEQEVIFRQQRLTVLSNPEQTHAFQIFSGYLLALFGGLLGFPFGYVLAYMKKTLPNGDRVYLYPPGERKHGKRILVLSAIFFSYWMWLLLSGGQSLIPWMRPL